MYMRTSTNAKPLSSKSCDPSAPFSFPADVINEWHLISRAMEFSNSPTQNVNIKISNIVKEDVKHFYEGS